MFRKFNIDAFIQRVKVTLSIIWFISIIFMCVLLGVLIKALLVALGFSGWSLTIGIVVFIFHYAWSTMYGGEIVETAFAKEQK